ncbi:ATP-binding protein [Actinomadura xylanilytica]|uniref:ATP-binding protein n=1 Tax=Actinomadura xylanilytica TaxID=887459 RepID=UPI00255B1D19|nr:ATP-binding protein [Actinomadura xylanilytica]MDL4774651.1 ATP-binding protein [Actinomadura xylanilytica]
MTTTPDCLLISLPASRAAAGLARTLVRAHLGTWDCTHISDDASLITSELITNASAVAAGGEIRFQLSRDVAGVLVAVWDPSACVPQPRPLVDLTLDTLDLAEAGWDDNGGRGLPIVAAIAVEWGHCLDPQGGKWVWARLKP